MNLLVTNDDGINADGIYHLAKVLSRKNSVLLVAPDDERSGSGHSTSLKSPLKYKKTELIKGVPCYAISGTPSDCVKFGISFLAKEKIDIVVAGINHGRNLGTDVIYSGTVGAAIEAIICGYSAVAVSYSGLNNYHFDYAAEFISKNLELLKKLSSAQRVINVNFPKGEPSEIKGVRVVPLGRARYNDRYVQFKSGTDEEGYILDKLPYIKEENSKDCDILFNVNRYITITPLGLDLTDYAALEKIGVEEFDL